MDLVAELGRIDERIKAANAELRELVADSGSTLMELTGIGPSSAARLLGDIGDIGRFHRQGPVRVLERHRAVGGVFW